MRKLLWLLLIATPCFGQTTYNAANCGPAAILAAVTAENAAAADGDIISIPPCAYLDTNGTWTGTGSTALTSAFTKNVTIQGAGAISATDHTSCTAPPTGCTTGTDQTIITNHRTGNYVMWQINSAPGKTVRVTGIAVYQDSSSGNQSKGLIALFTNGAGQATFRADHLHLEVNSGNVGIWVGGSGSGSVIGVGDHNYFSPGHNQTAGLTNNYAIHNGYGWNKGSTSDVNTSWNQSPGFGGSGFWFVEDNYMQDTDFTDGSGGSRYVFRYNTAYCTATTEPSSCQFFSHTTRDGERGDLFREIYGNVAIQPSNNTGNRNTLVPINTGVAMIWGNTVTNFGGVASIDNQRQYTGNFVFRLLPASLGYCGPAPYTTGTATVAANSTAVTGTNFSTNWATGSTFPNGLSDKLMVMSGLTCPQYLGSNTTIACVISSVANSTSLTFNGNSTTGVTSGTYQVGSPWDGNTTVYGYPCLDQAGRTGGNLLSGAPGTSGFTNAVTSSQSWPHQVLTPIYVWSNTFTPSPSMVGPKMISGNPNSPSKFNAANNVDFYTDFGSYSNAGAYNGTIGINQANRAPVSGTDTCTGGTDPATGGAAPGVGWWDTANSTLYVCNPTNTWTAYYTPYTYPHPLAAGGTPTLPAHLP